MKDYKPQYVKVVEGKYEGWSGYHTGRFTENGTPKLKLYDGHGQEIVIAVKKSDFVKIDSRKI
jgi:hypothetical protein